MTLFHKSVQKLRAMAVALALFCVISLFCLIALEGITGRFHFYSESLSASPNADYSFESDAFRFHVRLNSDGFRDREFPSGKKGSGKRVIFLGDSMTFGWGVEDEACFVRKTEALLHKQPETADWEFYNLGIEGTAPFEYRDVLASFGSQLQPDVVVVCYYTGNDAISDVPPLQESLRRPRLMEKVRTLSPMHLAAFFRHRVLPHFKQLPAPPNAFPGSHYENPLTAMLNDDALDLAAWKSTLAPKVIERALAWRINPFLVRASYHHPSMLHLQTNQYQQSVMNPAGKQVLQDIQTRTKALGAELRLLVLSPSYTTRPESWPFMESVGYTTRPALLEEKRFEQYLCGLARDLGIPVLSVYDDLKQATTYPYFKEDPHFTASGHRLVATALAPWLAHADAPDRCPTPPPPSTTLITEVVRWEFKAGAPSPWNNDAVNISPAPQDDALRMIATKNGVTLTKAYLLDTQQVNRLQFRARSQKGEYAAFFWGAPHDSGEGGYPFSPKRCVIIPITADGVFHEYTLALDAGVGDWTGQWDYIRLDPCSAHRNAYPMEGEAIDIDWIALGHE